jgi:hypothetical protein
MLEHGSASNERHIPDPIKREVRQRCGFGCVICGLPIYDYHHMEDWANVRCHEAANITLLCDQHHRRATSGLLTQEQVKAANSRPRNVVHGVTAPETLYFEGGMCEIHLSDGLYFRAEGSQFRCSPLVIGGVPLITITVQDRHLLLDLLVLEDDNTPLLKIEQNQLVASVGVWDIKFVGRTLTLRSEERQIRFEIEFMPPSAVRVNRGVFYARGTALRVYPDRLLVINSLNEIRGMRVGNATVGLAIDRSIPGGRGGFLMESDEDRIMFESVTEALALEPEFEKANSAMRERINKQRAGILPATRLDPMGELKRICEERRNSQRRS